MSSSSQFLSELSFSVSAYIITFMLDDKRRKDPYNTFMLDDKRRKDPYNTFMLDDKRRKDPYNTFMLDDKRRKDPYNTFMLDDKRRKGPYNTFMLDDKRRKGPYNTFMLDDKRRKGPYTAEKKFLFDATIFQYGKCEKRPNVANIFSLHLQSKLNKEIQCDIKKKEFLIWLASSSVLLCSFWHVFG